MVEKRAQITPEQALSWLAALCSRGEQAESDLRRKLQRWGIDLGEADRIVQRLKEESFLNEERFARAFVRDKARFNGWGRVKIAHALRQKQVSSSVILQALDEELDEESSRDTLLHLLQGKARTLAGREPRLARAALLRFAASRGFETDLCYRCVDEVCRTMNIPDDEQTD